MKSKLTIAAAAALALVLSGCGGGSDTPAAEEGGMTTLQVGSIGIGSDAALMFAIEKGYFEEQNLNVEVTTIANPPAGIAAAQSGELDLTYTPSIPLLNALSQGVTLKVVASADGYEEGAVDAEDLSKVDDTGLYVAADSGIESPADLEGMSVAVPARRAQLEVTISKVIQDAGGDPSTVNWNVLDFASAGESLSAGRVDAAGLVAPFTAQAEQDGNVLLASPGIEFFEEGAVGLWVTGEGTAESKAEALAGFREAINKANAYANDNLEEAQERGAELTGVSLEVLHQGAETYWPTEVKLEDIQRVNDLLVELGYLEQPVDLDGLIIE